MSAVSFLQGIERPKILYYIEQADYSGAELGQLPVMVRDADPLLACAPATSTERLAREHGIPTVAMPHRQIRRSAGPVELLKGIGRLFAAARDLRAVMRAHPERPIVYCFTVRAALVATLAAAGLRRRLVWHVTDFLPAGPAGWLIRALAALTAARIVPHSEALRRDFTGGWPRLDRRTRMINSGCQLETVRPDRVEPGRPRAVIVGHISPTKRTDLAVEIAARVVRRREDFELVVIGEAQYRDEDFALERALRERVALDPGLTDQVIFRGRTDDVAAELAQAGLLLHCRDDEPFGIVMLEAMACGLPVVAPAAGGALEIVEDGETGLLYPPGDADAAAGHVLRLLDDPALARRLGAGGLRRYTERFSLDAMVRLTEEVLGELSDGRSPLAVSRYTVRGT